MTRALLALLLAVCCVPGVARADQFRPAYMQIEQLGNGDYALLWKLPAIDGRTISGAHPVLPAGSLPLTEAQTTDAENAAESRMRVHIPGELEGKPVSFSGLSRTGLEILIRYRRADGSEQVGQISGASPSFTPLATPGRLQVALTYAGIGIRHILGGYDHLLFVLSLMLLVSGWRRLVTVATAFTLAHSLSLALATLNVIHVPSPPVEAAIALSIVFVAAEALRYRRGQESLTARKPSLIAFCFGLLHGLGFAGALAEIGLPQQSIPLALLCFNVGVEIGQVIFITCVLLIVWLCRLLLRNAFLQRQALTASTYAIGTVASFWLFERIAIF